MRPRSSAFRSACKWKRNNSHSRKLWCKYCARRRLLRRLSISSAKIQLVSRFPSSQSLVPLKRGKARIGRNERSQLKENPWWQRLTVLMNLTLRPEMAALIQKVSTAPKQSSPLSLASRTSIKRLTLKKQVRSWPKSQKLCLEFLINLLIEINFTENFY